MKIIIKTKNIEQADYLQKFVEEKFGLLKKFINILKREDEIGKTLAEVMVTLEKETNHHRKGQIFLSKAEIILPGRKLMAQAAGDDLMKTVIETKDELERKIKGYKGKKKETIRRAQKQSKL